MTLELLLNELIWLGWNAFWDELEELEVDGDEILDVYGDAVYSLNDLCSRESWIWRFVIDKKLYHEEEWLEIWNGMVNTLEYPDAENKYREHKDVEHRLMLSSIQEDKWKFILDNIKV